MAVGVEIGASHFFLFSSVVTDPLSSHSAAHHQHSLRLTSLSCRPCRFEFRSFPLRFVVLPVCSYSPYCFRIIFVPSSSLYS